MPKVLSTTRGRTPRAVLKTEGTVSSNTDPPRPVNNILLFFPRMKARSKSSESCWLVCTVIFLCYVQLKTANQDIKLICSYVFNFSVSLILRKSLIQTFKSYSVFCLCFRLVGINVVLCHREDIDIFFVSYRTDTFYSFFIFICHLIGIIKLTFV